MKQGRFYLAAAILLLASGCEKEDGENTDDSKWTHPLTTTLHRTDPGGEQSTYVITYTYDAKDRRNPELERRRYGNDNFGLRI